MNRHNPHRWVNFRPAPTGQDAIELPASLCAKVLLLNEMVRQRVKPAELARRLKTTAQQISRLTDLHHATKVDNVQEALQLFRNSSKAEPAP